MAFYFARIWLADSAAKLVLIAAVSVAKISAANKTSETRIKAGARRFSKYVQTDWQSCKIKVGQRGQGKCRL